MPKIPHFAPRAGTPDTDRTRNEMAFRQVFGELVRERAAQHQAEEARHQEIMRQWAEQDAEKAGWSMLDAMNQADS